MAKWVVVFSGRQIGKDGLVYSDLDLTWLPSDVLAVQSEDGITCELELGIRHTETHTGNQENVLTNTLDWWPNVEAKWQAAYDAEQAALAQEESDE